MNLRDRLRTLREEKGLSAAQLAGAFDKSEGAIRMWETGRSKPDADTLIKLSQYFECSTDYLLGLNDIRNNEEKLAINANKDELDIKLSEIPLPDRKKLQSAYMKFVKSYSNLNSYQSIMIQFMKTIKTISGDIEQTTLDLKNINMNKDDPTPFIRLHVFERNCQNAILALFEPIAAKLNTQGIKVIYESVSQKESGDTDET